MGTMEEKEGILRCLREKMELLEVKETAKSVFDEKYLYYKEHWRELV